MNKVTPKQIENLSKDDAYAVMFSAGMKLSESNKFWAEHGTKHRGGVFQAFLDYLAEAPRTQSELSDWLVNNSSVNEIRWFNQRDSIRTLSIAVFEKHGVKFTEKAETPAQRDKREKIVADHDKANKAKKSTAKAA